MGSEMCIRDSFRRGASNLLDRDVVRSLLSRFGTRAGTDDATQTANVRLETLPAGLSRFDVMNQSLEVMQSVLTRYRLAGDPPDVLVTVPKDACKTLDFHRAAEMIALGRDLTADALDRVNLTTPVR